VCFFIIGERVVKSEKYFSREEKKLLRPLIKISNGHSRLAQKNGPHRVDFLAQLTKKILFTHHYDLAPRRQNPRLFFEKKKIPACGAG
jgi:hypothetical protein